VSVPASDEDRATGVLWEAGTSGIEVRVAVRPGFVELVAYFEDRPDLRERLDEALADAAGTRAEPVDVPEVDWVAHVRSAFRPVCAGGFWILPVWQDPPPAPGPRTLIVDPGRAFGTGGHETTRLCLDALQALAARAPLGRVLDLGAGSGILAIAALRLGAQRATAIDLDPEALASAAHHARLNGVGPDLLLGDGASPFRAAAFDTIVANVSAPLLWSRSRELVALLRPAGALVLSGFLREDVPRLCDAYSFAGPARAASEGEWAALVVRGARSDA
jgi:ribosomal protein L11 methyltransferase